MSIGLDDSLSPIPRPINIWTNAGLLRTNFNEILIKIFSYTKMHQKIFLGNGGQFVQEVMDLASNKNGRKRINTNKICKQIQMTTILHETHETDTNDVFVSGVFDKLWQFQCFESSLVSAAHILAGPIYITRTLQHERRVPYIVSLDKRSELLTRLSTPNAANLSNTVDNGCLCSDGN